MREPAIGPVVTLLGRAAVFDWTVMDVSSIALAGFAGGEREGDGGGTRPYAGMTRFRFKGHRAAALRGPGGLSAPCGGAPLGSDGGCGAPPPVSNPRGKAGPPVPWQHAVRDHFGAKPAHEPPPHPLGVVTCSVGAPVRPPNRSPDRSCSAGLSQMALVPEPPANTNVAPDAAGDSGLAAPRNYLELYGFARAPFAAGDPHGGFVLGASHRSALELLAGAMLAGRSAVVLTGEAQTGKTSLLETAIGMVSARGVHVVRVANWVPGPLSLKRLLSRVLGIPEPAQLSAADSDRAHAVLTAIPKGASHGVLAIDDADTLSTGALRYLTQLCRQDRHAPQLVLVGAPAIWPLLRQGEFRHLTHRISVRLRLARLTAEEVRLYIERRLWIAGSDTRKVLTPSALTEILIRTEGIPGQINVALERVFAAGFEHGHPRVTPQTVRLALGLPRPPTYRPPAPRRAPPIWLIAGTTLAVGMGAALYSYRSVLPDVAAAVMSTAGSRH